MTRPGWVVVARPDASRMLPIRAASDPSGLLIDGGHVGKIAGEKACYVGGEKLESSRGDRDNRGANGPKVDWRKSKRPLPILVDTPRFGQSQL